MDVWTREFQAKGITGTKTEQESSWCVIGAARKPVWLELSGQDRNRGRDQRGKGC